MEEGTAVEEGKGRLSFMDDMTLFVFSGVPVFALVMWFFRQYLPGSGILFNDTFFRKKDTTAFQVTYFAIADQQNNYLPSECLAENVFVSEECIIRPAFI